MRDLLEYKGYHAKVELSLEDDCFIGTVIGINDSLNFHGSTIEELISVFHNSIDDYLEMCATFDKTPEKEYKGSLNIRIGSELHKKIDIAAQKYEMTLNQFICKTLEESFEPNKTKEIVYYVPYKINDRDWKYTNEANNYKDMNSFTKQNVMEVTISK